MWDHAERIANTSFIASLSVSVTLMLEEFMTVLDNHQGVVGFIGMVASIALQWYYKHRAIKIQEAAGGERRKQ